MKARILGEAGGNPLALIELPRGLTPAELAGGFAVPDAQPGEAAGLVELGLRVRLTHPLVRSAVYGSAGPGERREAHAALADATDPARDPDRRAWHRAHATAAPDEAVAAELARSADRAQARGGLAAAAAFLERAVVLTADPARHSERTLAAAQANMQAGAFSKAQGLLVTAEAGPLDEFASARVDLLRGQIAFATGPSNDAPPLLLKAAKRLESLNLELARETYLSAWAAASFAGRLAGAGDMNEVARAARALPPVYPPRPIDLLLDGLALLLTDGRTAAAPILRRAATVFAAGGVSREDGLRWGWMAASLLWDDDAARKITTRQVRLSRDAGALDELPLNLVSLAMSAVWSGDFATAAALIAETDAIREITGSRLAPYAAMFLAALRGDQGEVIQLINAAIADAGAAGQGAAVTSAHWAGAILYNGLGRYSEAFAAAKHATEDAYLFVSMWALPELVEAAVRTGKTQVATEALKLLAETTQSGGTEFGLGIEARSRALLGEGEHAELDPNRS